MLVGEPIAGPPGEGLPPAPPAEAAAPRPEPPPPEPPVPPVPEGDLFPERMKANRALAGRICPGCGGPVELGDDVFNCPRCQATMHLGCRDAAGGCASEVCRPPAPPPAAAAPAAVLPPLARPPAGGPQAACRFCGEMIPVGARKCRFCGEYQLDADRQAIAAQSARLNTSLETWEWLVGIFASLFACGLGTVIWGIVLLAMGRTKGWKLIIIAVCVDVVLVFIGFMIGFVSHR
jgi:hypothetical protein